MLISGGLKSWLFDQFQLQAGRVFLWAPVWLGCGVALYFSLNFEPLVYWGVVAFAFFGLVLYAFKGRALFWAVLPLAIAALGFIAGQVRTSMVVGPSLERDLNYANISGVIDELDVLDIERGQLRFGLRDVVIENIALEDTPHRVRVSMRSDSGGVNYRVGDRVEGLAGLNALPEPVIPGGFDFGRHMAFKGVGALGFFYGAPEVVDTVEAAHYSLQSLRQVVEARVIDGLPPSQAAVTAALLTGKRTGIEEADLEAMRHSGLAHMLAISGLHVGLFSGVVFFVLRLGLVMIPGVGLGWPVKKIVAVLALMAAIFYMLLAGATIPTQRAVLMVGVVFLAVLIDRTAISLRLVTFAAFVVLLFMPESLLSVSFQLSFAAVVALIWAYDGMRGWLSAMYRQAGFWRRAGLYVGGVCLTTIVATIATAPFALYHFEQLAVLSVLANVLAMPLMSFVVMPFAVLVLPLMAVGLEQPALWVMGHGVEAVLGVAHFVSDQEYAVLRVAAWPFEAFMAVVLGALFIVLMQGPLRWIGLVGFVVAVFLVQGNRLPDILVAESHDLWAYQRDGQLYVSARNKERFMRENWERYYGLEVGDALRWSEDEKIICDWQACRTELRGKRVSFVRDVEVMATECAWADILVSARSMRLAACEAEALVDWQATKRDGTHAVWIDDRAVDSVEGGVRLDTVRAHLGQRRWNER